jgi:cold shock CspA family protein
MKRKNHGHVAKFVAGEGYGFIETADGRKVYFHRNSVLDDAFEHLTVGSEVHWQLTESGFEFCLQTGHVGAPCIRVAVAQKRPVLEPNRFRYAFPPCNRPTACRGDMPGGHRAGAGIEPARRAAVATRGRSRDFPMQTRPESMDWHNASTLPINWRDASPARPVPNWRSKQSAVAPVARPRLG